MPNEYKEALWLDFLDRHLKKRPRCIHCGALIILSNYVCSGCGRVQVLPEDIKDELR